MTVQEAETKLSIVAQGIKTGRILDLMDTKQKEGSHELTRASKTSSLPKRGLVKKEKEDKEEKKEEGEKEKDKDNPAEDTEYLFEEEVVLLGALFDHAEDLSAIVGENFWEESSDGDYESVSDTETETETEIEAKGDDQKAVYPFSSDGNLLNANKSLAAVSETASEPVLRPKAPPRPKVLPMALGDKK
jgi:hypothetical protein